MIIMNGKTQIKEKKNLAYKNERHTRYKDICDHWWETTKNKILSKSCPSNLDSIVKRV
jgi:hypothetical protein